MSLNLEQVKSDLMNIYNIDSNIINDKIYFNYKGLSIVKSDFSSILIKDKILNDIDKKYIISEIKRYKSYNGDNSNYWNDDIENYQNILNNNKVDIILSCLCYSTNNIIQNLELYIFLESKLNYSNISSKFHRLYDKNIILNDYKAFLPTNTNKQVMKNIDDGVNKIDIKELLLFVDSLKNQLKDYDKRHSYLDLDFYILDNIRQSRYFNISNIIKIITYNLKYAKNKVNDIKNNKIITHFSYDFVKIKNVDIQTLNILDDQFLHKYVDILPYKDNDIENNNILSITFYSNDKQLNTLSLKLK